MKRIFTFLILLCAAVGAGAQVLPEFSTADDPIYYYIQFQNGGACVADQGSGANLQTATKANVDAQKWAFIGTKNSFRLLCKTGRYMNFSNSYFTASATGTTLKMVATTNSSYSGSWELQRTSSSGVSMNQWGGAGTGKNLGEWSAGDSGNPVQFVAAQAIYPKFSTDEDETYYFLQFARSGNYLADQGVGANVLTATADDADTQKWKFVGDKDALQLVDKAGHYAVITGTGNSARMQTSEEEPANTFSLVESTNTSYSGFELHYNGTTADHANVNQWGDIKVGQEIGLWSAGDQNNVFTYIKESDMQYADYKVSGSTTYVPDNKLTLWYTQPATLTGVGNIWMEYSLPIGNGQLGASLFGGVFKDQVQFNEKTLWKGRNTDNSASYGGYQNFGSLYAENIADGFNFGESGRITDYVRTLNLAEGIGTVSFTGPDSVKYERTYLVSNPDNVIAVHYTAGEAGKINLKFTLDAGSGVETTYDGQDATFSGKFETISYAARMRIVPTGGTLTSDEDGITVKDADEVLALLTGATDFDAYSATYVSNTSQVPTNVETTIADAENKGWDDILSDHQADFKSYFDRVNFELDGTENTLPTNQLVDLYKNGATQAQKAELEQLYFAYGRYLEICSSRGVDLPSNLQGIWNDKNNAPWNSDIHANINVQMNYWPAEPTNLSEMHLPFLNYTTNMAMNHTEWQGYAKASGQTVGWTFYTENNIFGGVGSFMHNYVIGNAWNVSHLWQHYRYTLDKDFLKGAFPTMWSCCEYWIERMVKATDGTYECPNEYSPEQGPTENATAHSQQLVVELFENTMAAAKVLGDDAGLTDEQLATLQDYIDNSDRGLAIETYTGKWGSPCNGIYTGDSILREWKYTDYTAGENGHRHQSHLMCLYPFAQVKAGTPEFRAAVNSLKLRSDNSTGWSMGWRINLWARALDGDHAYTILGNALKHATSYGTNQAAGGIYYNLYDSHAPFQIDGNFGACAGIAEMLMQSCTDTINILPALPSVWTKGSITGLKAVGNFEVSISWTDGKAKLIDIKNLGGQPLVVKSGDLNENSQYFVNGTAINVTAADGVVAIPCAQGDAVTISVDGSELPSAIGNVLLQATPAVAVNGRTVTLTGEGISGARVYDLQGRQLLRTGKRTFTVPRRAGNTVVLRVDGEQGQKSYKVGF